MSAAAPVVPQGPGSATYEGWNLPYKGKVAMYCLIFAESTIFAIFVVAYIYYIGRVTFGPTPKQVLEVPLLYTVCLLSSSLTIWLAERALHTRSRSQFQLWWGVTILLGGIFLFGTGLEWHKLIAVDGLKINTNVFGTTYYCLVGLHASHVIVGLLLLSSVWLFGWMGMLTPEHTERVETLALYWHFVDAVWVVVFTVVYIIGR